MTYGSRARIGYTCPIYLAEVFPYDFYRVVPDGVTLVTATASVWEGTPAEMAESARQARRAAVAMAKAGCHAVVLGGVPVGFASGHASVEDLVQEVSAECGVPVTASLLCQNHALAAVGARKVVMLRPGEGARDQHVAAMRDLGLTILEVRGIGDQLYSNLPSAEETLALARALLRDHPDADTLHCSSPHWPMVANIAPLEEEFGVAVITAGQAIIWEALRLCGIEDRIPGYGRLLQEH
jgi:maleate isomerase